MMFCRRLVFVGWTRVSGVGGEFLKVSEPHWLACIAPGNSHRQLPSGQIPDLDLDAGRKFALVSGVI